MIVLEQVNLVAREAGTRIPQTARKKRVLITGDDDQRTGITRALDDRAGSGCVAPRNAAIVKNVVGDGNEVHLELSRIRSELAVFDVPLR